jgi:hypothetical protein
VRSIHTAKENAPWTTHTSRRAILAGAASVPIAAAAATSPALAGADDAELVRLATEVKAAYDELGDAIDVQSVAETRLFQWRDANPEPAKESASWIEWLRRDKRESGCDEAYAAEGAASDKLSAAIDALCETPARTIGGLIAKARLVEIDQDALGHRIGPSIIGDLLAMAASKVTSRLARQSSNSRQAFVTP